MGIGVVVNIAYLIYLHYKEKNDRALSRQNVWSPENPNYNGGADYESNTDSTALLGNGRANGKPLSYGSKYEE